MVLVVDAPLGPPGEHGCARLATALEGRGWRCRRAGAMPDAAEATLAFVVAVTPAAGGLSRELASRAGAALPQGAETLAFAPLPAAERHPSVVLIAGGDERGLLYALLETARRVELGAPVAPGGRPERADSLAAVTAMMDLFPSGSEAPERRLRSVCVFPHHAEMDAEWFRSLDFWRWYFDLLALHRFNRFTLTFGHQTAYLAPPYPYFVAVPEHPEVTVPELTADAREENLALLQGIARLAVERGLDFTLGVWSQHAYSYGASAVVGLEAGNLASYCAAGVRRLLQAVPDISAVQLRVNSESGIHLDEGAHFWRAIFGGVAACGRPVTLDLRAKGLVEDTIQAGLDTGLPVIVDTKFWTEHHGLPYHATLLQQGDRYVRRHSYADQLRYPAGRERPYDFLFQLWNLGTNRLLLWADAEWVRQFAASSTLGGAAGFEVCVPLSHKGFGNRGAPWRIFADTTYEHYRWEQERYWPWYALFGRLGYSGATDPDAWRREWAARVGSAAATFVERALQAASGVLPLLTACHSPSASVFGYWPEKDMGGLLDLYLQVEGSDVGMFASAQETVEAALRRAPDARRTPRQSGAVLAALADEAEHALELASSAARPSGERASRELRSVALDVRVQAQLGRYHAAKQGAAEHLAWFYATGDLDSLLAARPAAGAALHHWERLAALTDGVYQDDLVFGRPADQDGHWKDNLAYARHDVARIDEVEGLFRRYGLFDRGFDFGGQLPPRTGTPPLPFLHDYAVERRFTGVGPQTLYTPETGFGWGGTYGLLATAAPTMDGKTLRAAAPKPEHLPREALYCDFVHRHPAAPYDNASFLVDLPNGEYEVTTILADRSANPLDHGPMLVRLQGRQEQGPVAVPAGEIVELRQRVRVTSGRLDVEVSAPPQGDWLLTGLIITHVAPHIGHRPPAHARPGETLDVLATVTSPEALRSVTLCYRSSDQGAFVTQPLSALPEGLLEQQAHSSGHRPRQDQRDGPETLLQPEKDVARPAVRFATRLDVPSSAALVEYYLQATDVHGTTITWPAQGAATPRRLYLGHADTAPTIEHEPIRLAHSGEALEVRARVNAAAPLARVTLHYRNVNQMQTHERCNMTRPDPSGPEYRATIPAADVSAEWDVMYHLEAVDVLGNAAFCPGLAAGTPYVVVPVNRRPQDRSTAPHS